MCLTCCLTTMTKPDGFDDRLAHSLDLVRKSERTALIYDNADGFYLAFSGGKDSQALYHLAKMAGVRFKAHMNFTSVDPPQVIRFVREHYPDVVGHAPDKSIYTYALEMGMLPSISIRWCCERLKETKSAGRVTLVGVRAAESKARAKRDEIEVTSHKFSGSYDEFVVWQAAMQEKRDGVVRRKYKRLKMPINDDLFTIEHESELRCVRGNDAIIVSPLFHWSDDDVWYFLDDVVKVPHCELYDWGYKRIGCILCPMSGHTQKRREIADFPRVKRQWIETIGKIRAKRTELTGMWADLTDDEIFDWWISKQDYETWYAKNKAQQKLDF